MGFCKVDAMLIFYMRRISFNDTYMIERGEKLETVKNEMKVLRSGHHLGRLQLMSARIWRYRTCPPVLLPLRWASPRLPL